MKRGKNLEYADDTVHKLNDDLLRHIVNMLPTKDAVRTSVLSWRWQKLLRSISKIELRSFKTFPKDNYRSSFLNMVDRILDQHDSSDIQRFVICCDVGVDAAHMHRWISKVIKHKVQKFHLCCGSYGHGDELRVLPFCLFKSVSLTDLKIETYCHIKGSDSSLFSVQLPCLKRLELSGVAFLDNHSAEQFFSNIPKLQQLCLYGCFWENINRLIIDIPTLERVELLVIYVHEYDCQVTIVAPNLHYFNCRTNFSIDILLSKHSLPPSVVLVAELFTDRKRLALTRLLESVKTLMSLRASWIFSQWRDFRSIPALDLPIFINITQLNISAELFVYKDANFKRIMFLDKTPNLQFLTITMPGSNEAAEMVHLWYFKDDAWSSDNVSSCVTYKIKKVSISRKVYKRKNDERDYTMAAGLIKYFMSHSQSLELLEVKGFLRKSVAMMDEIERHLRYLELKNVIMFN